MKHWAIFCRSNHPRGYGGFTAPQVTQDDEGFHIGSAHPARTFDGRGTWRTEDRVDMTGGHGYVTVAVWCEDEVELDQARSIVSGAWFQWSNRKDDWYAGALDFVGALPAAEGDLMGIWTHEDTDIPIWRSLGDNRAFAVLDLPTFLEHIFPTIYERPGQ